MHACRLVSALLALGLLGGCLPAGAFDAQPGGAEVSRDMDACSRYPSRC